MVIASVMSSPLLAAGENDSLSSDQFVSPRQRAKPSSSSTRIKKVVKQQQREQKQVSASASASGSNRSNRKSSGRLEAIHESVSSNTNSSNHNQKVHSDFEDAGQRVQMVNVVKKNNEIIKNRMKLITWRGNTSTNINSGGNRDIRNNEREQTNNETIKNTSTNINSGGNHDIRNNEREHNNSTTGTSTSTGVGTRSVASGIVSNSNSHITTAVKNNNYNYNNEICKQDQRACTDLALQLQWEKESGRISERICRMAVERANKLEQELQEVTRTQNNHIMVKPLQDALAHIDVAERRLLERELQAVQESNRALEANLLQLSKGITGGGAGEEQQMHQEKTQAVLHQAKEEAAEALKVAQATHRREKKVWQKEKRVLDKRVSDMESIISEQAQACKRQLSMHKNERIALMDEIEWLQKNPQSQPQQEQSVEMNQSIKTSSIMINSINISSGTLKPWDEEYEEEEEGKSIDDNGSRAHSGSGSCSGSVVSSCKTAPVGSDSANNDRKHGHPDVKEEQHINARPLTLNGLLTRDSNLNKRSGSLRGADSAISGITGSAQEDDYCGGGDVRSVVSAPLVDFPSATRSPRQMNANSKNRKDGAQNRRETRSEAGGARQNDSKVKPGRKCDAQNTRETRSEVGGACQNDAKARGIWMKASSAATALECETGAAASMFERPCQRQSIQSHQEPEVSHQNSSSNLGLTHLLRRASSSWMSLTAVRVDRQQHPHQQRLLRQQDHDGSNHNITSFKNKNLDDLSSSWNGSGHDSTVSSHTYNTSA
jgi:hypothetical protein